jgi:hypothetical protein
MSIMYAKDLPLIDIDQVRRVAASPPIFIVGNFGPARPLSGCASTVTRR